MLAVERMLTVVTSDDSFDLEQRARTGDPAAFGQFIRAWDTDLRGVAWSVVRSASATDDVMQNAYERAFRSLDRFDGRSSMKTWLHSIVYRSAIDHVRYEGRRRHDDVDDLRPTAADRTGTSPEARVLAGSEVREVLDSCTQEQRTMLMLTAGLGFSFDETAEILGESRGTVASRVSRLRARLIRWEDNE